MAFKQIDVFIDRFLMPLDDPGSRLFHLNLLIAFILVLGWLLVRFGARDFWGVLERLVFRKKYWWNRSTKFDYQIYFLNSLLKLFLFIPFLDFSFEISRFVSLRLFKAIGDFATLPSTSLNLILFTLAVFVWDDFLRFGQHVLMHKVPWLWRLHQVHHSARVLTPITLYRTHPLESAFAALRNGLSLGVAAGVFIFLFGAQFNIVTLFGVNAFGFMFNFLGANLRHSHIDISFGSFFEKIFISPKQHQIHHSINPQHFDRNFGVSLALWDQLMGSLVYSTEASRIRVGLAGQRAHGMRNVLLKKQT